MSISFKFSDLEGLSERDKKKIFKLFFDVNFSQEYEYDWKHGNDVKDLVEEARKHEIKLSKTT